jgi:hypothetical protein
LTSFWSNSLDNSIFDVGSVFVNYGSVLGIIGVASKLLTNVGVRDFYTNGFKRY